MFDLPGMHATLEQASDCELVYFSPISLAVVNDRGASSRL